MVSTMIFDMDGVLVNSHPVHKLAWSRLMQTLGRSASEKELEFALDGRKRDDILRFFLGDLSDSNLRQLGLKKDMFFAECAGELQLVEGVRDFVAALREAGVHLAVATSASRSRAERMLDKFELKQYFTAVVTGDDVTKGKPDPAVFQAACERLHGVPATSLVVEDAVSGVKGARAAGMKCLGVADNNRSHLLYEAGAHFVVPNFVGLEINAVFQLLDREVHFNPGIARTETPNASINSF